VDDWQAALLGIVSPLVAVIFVWLMIKLLNMIDKESDR